MIIGAQGSTWLEVLTNFLSPEQLAKYGDLEKELKENESLYTKGIPQGEEKNFFNKVSSSVDKLNGVLSAELNSEFTCGIYEMTNTADGTSEVNLFKVIIASIDDKDLVYMDVTHGFRSTPMFALMAVQYFQFIKNVEFKKVFYGWVENKLDVKPIVDLTNLVTLGKWIISFAQYTKTSDISAFASLLGKNAKELNAKLRKSALYEKVTLVSDSIDVLKDLEIDQFFQDDNPLINTIKDPLEKKLAYVKEDSSAYSVFLLSQQFLDAKDYLRAIIYLHESLMVYYSEVGTLKYDLRRFKDWNKDDLTNICSQLRKIKEAVNEKLPLGKQLKKLLQSINDSVVKKDGFKLYDAIAKYFYNVKVAHDVIKLFTLVNKLRNAVAHGTPDEDLKNDYYKNDKTMCDKLKVISRDVGQLLRKEKPLFHNTKQ